MHANLSLQISVLKLHCDPIPILLPQVLRSTVNNSLLQLCQKDLLLVIQVGHVFKR